MLEDLKRKVLDANRALEKKGLVRTLGGNVSEIDRETGLIVIKPSGVPFDELTVKDMMVVDLMGNVVDGVLHPSVDTPTHIELYRAFDEIGGIAHTYSTFATAYSQAGKDIPFLGSAHAEHFYGDIPCSRPLSLDEVEGEYETNVAYAIIDCIEGLNPMEVPAVLVKSLGLYTFGNDAQQTVVTAERVEELAKIAFVTEMLSPDVDRAEDFLLEKHFFRKRNRGAFYGKK